MQTRERAYCARSVFPFIKKKKNSSNNNNYNNNNIWFGAERVSNQVCFSQKQKLMASIFC